MNNLKYIKKAFIIVTTITAVSLTMTCSEESGHGPYGSDGIPPDKVTINEVVNTPGGAVIFFTPPTDEDLLYIKASFEDENQLSREVIVSAVIDSLSIVDLLRKEHTL